MVITRIDIENFRGVRTGGVAGLSPLSIIVGPNNSGKSTVLEALAALKSDNAGATLRQLLRRGGPPSDAIRHIVLGDKASFKGYDEHVPSDGPHAEALLVSLGLIAPLEPLFA